MFVIVVVIASNKDYYETLGVKRNANVQEIRRRFRQLALEYHPDKNKDPQAEEKFRSIVEAYEVLTDPEKRRRYDEQGHKTFKSSTSADSTNFHFNMNDFFNNWDTNWFDLDLDDSHAEFPFDFQSENFYFNDDSMFDEFFNVFKPQQENCRTVFRRQGDRESYVRECF